MENNNGSPVVVRSSRGVKRGTVRGQYKRNRNSPKRRILEAARNSRDWTTVAENCGINRNTAYAWVNKQAKGQDVEDKPRGGRRHGKVNPDMVNNMLDIIGEDPTITLKELALKISEMHGINPPISVTTINNHLDGRLFTVKRVHKQAENVNTPENKVKRRIYVERVMAALGAGKHVVYLDESNVNLFCTRTVGRSARGQRVVLHVPGSKGPNIHMVAGISQQGLINFTRRRGAYKHPDVNQWVAELLNSVFAMGYDAGQVALVIDNAPCHSRVEQLHDQAAFAEVEFIRLPPYSPALNPIEMAWSAIKAVIKRDLPSVIHVPQPEDITKVEHRLRLVETAIDRAYQVVTPAMSQAFCNRVQRHHARWLREEDLPVGE